MTNNSSNPRMLRRAPLLFLLCLCSPFAGAAQQSAADRPGAQATQATVVNETAKVTIDAKAEQIIAQAVAAVGGNAYLAVRSTVGRGVVTPFAKGVSQLPLSFTDYLVFPDKERTEYRGSGNYSIDAYVGKTGWLFDAATRALKDQPPARIADFQLSLRTSLDNLLRNWWRRDGATLSYVGRREAGLARRNETVRLTYPDGFIIDYEIGAKDHLPAKALYKRKNEDGAEVQEEDRYARYLTISGITLPFIVDHYRAGDQTSRIIFDAIEFNQPVPDTLFAKPASLKAVK